MMRTFVIFGFALALFLGLRYPDNPPLAHTGGFGEPTCHACHFDGNLNAEGGRLDLRGLDQSYIAGGVYKIEVLLSREGMVRAGFQLSARFAEGALAGKQAGEFHSIDHRLAIKTEKGTQYIHQTESGSEVPDGDSTIWHLAWKAPAAHIPIIFHIAANAANGDESEFGDVIYHTSVDITRNP